ncbi:Myb-like DNA-binding domain containing protein [Tritrichomonas foetus]|uniref:Myb-like DNA-binding domain containing protein n=1 Tax=Tritrichomonas foetus TaxID=1144522 RepID=A0A1J4J8X6_9EUKA|nr:Myb-like DNA-binding domain containing protein [Tritrichomonas foetus]|eukprot:OHS94139.1 Myb-like DNA-binding domain containing protein [Tritrichomonas foetus]
MAKHVSKSINNKSYSNTTANVHSSETSTLRKRFTDDEDKKLKHIVIDLGIHNWEEVSTHMPGRTARQCRDRYNNYLFKEISSTNFTAEEDAIILQKYSEIGPHWVAISQYLVGRSGNNVKNRWYKFLSKIYSNEFFCQSYYPVQQAVMAQQNYMNMYYSADTVKVTEEPQIFNPDSWIVEQMEEYLDLDWEQLANTASSTATSSALSN